MPANRAMVSQHSNPSVQEREVASIVEKFIAKRGYDTAIVPLLEAIHDLAVILSADPLNHSKERELRIWARVVKSAIRRHRDENTFEGLIRKADIIRARGMGIRLV